MSNIQEAYMNRLIVSNKEIEDAKFRYDELVKDYLVHRLSNEEALKFIGDNILLALMAIYAYRSNDYDIGFNGCDDEIRIGHSEIVDGVLVNIPEEAAKKMSDQLDILDKVLEIFFEDVAMYEVSNQVAGILIGKKWIDLAHHETECHDGWTYSEAFCFEDKYSYFFARLEKLFLDNTESIIRGLLSGKYTGLFDIIGEDCRVNDIYKKLDIQSNAAGYIVRKSKEKIKLVIDEYINTFVKPEIKTEAG